MFTILETWTNGLLLSILKVLFIKKYKLELCIQKQFNSHLLFNNILGLSEENTTTSNKSAGLQ